VYSALLSFRPHGEILLDSRFTTPLHRTKSARFIDFADKPFALELVHQALVGEVFDLAGICLRHARGELFERDGHQLGIRYRNSFVNGFVHFKNSLENGAVAGLEKFLHDRNGGFFVGFGDSDALDPAAQKSFHRISLGRQKRFADDDGAARIPDRQLREIDHFVKTQLLGL